MSSGEEIRDPGTVRVVLRRDGTMIRTVITDDGPGVSHEIFDRIFDPFFTTKPQGTGLGSSIAARIVHEYGGKIFASSPDSGGLAVTVELPESGVREQME